jgi:hypothetical protein
MLALNRKNHFQGTIIVENTIRAKVRMEIEKIQRKRVGKASEPLSGVDAITAASKGPKQGSRI